MDFSLFLTIVAVAIGFFVIRRFRFNPENSETDSPPPSSLCPASPPSSLCSVPLPSPSSSSHNSSHDVFPSFRGEDIRGNFLSHVQKEFQRKGITYFNDNGIERGESIGPGLVRAIKGSKIAIVLLSENYASSKWCLDELVEIMKCKETVIPVFYKVDPSDVKKLRGYFGKVFRKTCEGKSKEDTEKWRQALEKVATVAGYDASTWHNEAAMIEKIATDVSDKLTNAVASSDFDSFVGMRAHMEHMDLLLRLDSYGVRMIGIWGPSGIGKSTIARSLFSQHSHDFQLSVFMDNIKRDYPRPCLDKYSAQLQLQNKFLSLIFSWKDVTIHHLGVAPARLNDKKVLVVLDDVDKAAQLDALAKVTSWFGPGSRIIVTTQDRRILKAHQINHIYEVGFPHDDEALEIFCMNAFGQKSPYDGFWSLAWEVTRLAGKLPLGLSVMGSYFKGLPKEEWEHEMPGLRTRLDGEIESILKFGYDALCRDGQDLFLHIACFFNGVKIDKVQECLAHNLRGVKSQLHTLAERSLISVDINWEYIEMHDLLARLGRDIVRKQSPNDPGQRQFLVDNGDICQVLRDDTLGSCSVIAINLIEWENKLEVSDRVFDRMNNVQFLRIGSKSQFVLESLNCLPREVRLLHLEHFPMTCLPSNFNTEFLVEIYMPYSKLEKLWGGNKTIGNLKWMNLSHSKNLKELPDFSTATNFRELILSNCSSLVELPFSIGNKTKLKTLKLYGCSSLVKLPSSIENMTNLENLILEGCSSLVELPSIIGNMSDLKDLKIIGCSSIVKLPSSIVSMTNIKNLDLGGCWSLVKLPSSIGNMTNLEKLNLDVCLSLVELPSSIGNMANLKDLNIMRCSSIVKLPSSIGNMINLQNLNLRRCSSIVELPFSIGNMVNLQNLDLRRCSSIVELPFSIGNMTNLKNLYLNGCSSLVKLPSSIGNMTNLEILILRKCLSLANLPSSIGGMTNLKKLDLKRCSSVVKLPSSIGNMKNIKILDLEGCSSLVELPNSIGNMTNLEHFDLCGCSNLVKLPSSIGNMTNLERLNLNSCSRLVELPSSIGSMTNLKKLQLDDCSSLVELPCSLGNITNLKKLSLYGCSSLVELPYSIGNLINLEKLHLNGCSSLLELPSSIGNMTNIKDFWLAGCSSLAKLPSSIGNMTHLKKFWPWNCSSLVELPFSIGNLTNIQELKFSGCSSLVELPSSIGNMANLVTLHLDSCSSLVELPSSIGNITNLEYLNLDCCSSLGKLPSSIGNMTNLQNFYLKECSSLVELPSSIENMTKLQKLDLTGCSSLVELPSSIGNMTNLWWLKFDKCSSLVELPSSIENMTNIKSLYLTGSSSFVELTSSIWNMTNLVSLELRYCSSFIKLPSSIGNLHDLRYLRLKGCSKLKALPININLKSLDELDLSDCSSLKRFPEISTNISVLKLNGTAIEEIPPSIRSWSRLERFHMSYSENLGKSQHAFDLITKLHLTDKLIQEIAPWVKEMPRLEKLVIKGCTKLVSLPQLPDSLKYIDSGNCESLERLDCSFYNTKLTNLSFVNCFKLNQEARDLILNAWTEEYAVFPGEEVPAYFSYRATGSSVSVKLNGVDTRFPTSLRFKACFLVVKNPSHTEWDRCSYISYCIKDKLSGVKVNSGYHSLRWKLSPQSDSEHLFVVEFEEAVTSPELVVEFEFDNRNGEIKECEIRYSESLAPSC